MSEQEQGARRPLVTFEAELVEVGAYGSRFGAVVRPDGEGTPFRVGVPLAEHVRALGPHLYERVRVTIERVEVAADDAAELRVFAADDDSVHDLLSLAVNFTPGVYGAAALEAKAPPIVREKIRGWSQEEREAACRWAGAVHARASDNDEVQIPPKPACVVDLEDALDNVGIVP